MQSLAAYSFDAHDIGAGERLQRVDELIDKWLTAKGVETPRATDGDFQSKTGDGTGQFSRQTTVSSVGSTREVELIETAHTGAIFTTVLQVTHARGKVAIFVTMTATPGASVVAPMKIYPRCPGIVRSLITEFSDWQYAGQVVPVGLPFDATTASGVQTLCAALSAGQRRLPLVVVSVDGDEQVWPDLHVKAAEQLIGLADVAYVDAESSWHLTDELGNQDSCFLGAVRLYWPMRRGDGSYEGITWTAPRLANFGEGDAGSSRFLAVLRRTVMSTAALTMTQPHSFREVQRTALDERHATLEEDGQEQDLLTRNAALAAALDEAQQTIESLKQKLAASAYALRASTAANDEEADEPPAEASEPAHVPPEAGEIRYYKKIGTGGGVDTLVQTDACQHKASQWRTAFKAEQAKKGLVKLEGRDNWQSMSHCSGCTGGGRWMVRW